MKGMSADPTPHGQIPEASRRLIRERITVRLSQKDRQIVERRAEERGVTMSGFLRVCALETPEVKARKRKPSADLVELARLLVALNRIGNNLNQIARACNSGEAVSPIALEECLKALLAVKGEALKALG